MKKLCVLVYSIGILSICVYGLYSSSFYVQLLMNLNDFYMTVRITLVLCLVAYAFIPQLRLYTTRFLFGFSGAVLLALGTFAVWSPTLLGYSSGYILFGDSISFIEGGILAIVLSAELSARRSKIIATNFLNLKTLFATQPKKQKYSSLNPSVVLKAHVLN